MKIQFLISFISVFVFTTAIQISDGLIKANGRELSFSQVDQTIVPVVFNDTTSKLDLSFKIHSSSHPDQIFIKISNKDNIETSLKPIVKSINGVFNAKLSITYSKLPSLFKISPSLKLSLIIASFKDSEPIYTDISSIELTDDLISKAAKKYEKPQRFTALPEIHHIFQTAPKTVNAGIALIFSSFSIVSLIGLIGVWTASNLINFKNFPKDSIIQHFAFIGLIICYEVVFFQYYLGSTIFATIGKVFILLGPTVFFGSRVLSYIGTLRLAGKR